MQNKIRKAVWRPIADLDGIWRAERTVHGVPLRAVAFRLADGSLAIYSPIRGLGGDAHRELTNIGRPAVLIAPNHFHNLGLDEYAAAYPEASIVASETAMPRTQKKCTHAVGNLDRLQETLPTNVSILAPPGTRTGEVWLSAHAPSGRAWIVGDAFFNIARTPRSAMGLLLRILGISSGLRIGSSFRWLLRERAVYRRWLTDAITSQSPIMLIPCHGDILSDAALSDRLQRLVVKRL